MQTPRTCVIGAGISGLTAGKALADYGIDCTCFESSCRVGGNWAFANPNGHSSGLPVPNHHFLEAHPTLSSELLVRLGSGDARAKPDVERLDGEVVHFVDGTAEAFDAIIWATGYKITFPFFDPAFLSAPGNRLPLYNRMLKPGLDDLVRVGFAQALPTLCPFAESQSRLLAAYAAGRYRPPARDEMEATIRADEQRFAGHYADSPRHTQQVDYFVYAHEMRTKELPAGRRRVAELGPVPLAGRAAAAA